MSEKTMGKEMLEKLSYKKKNVFEEANSEKIKAIYDDHWEYHQQALEFFLQLSSF